MALKLNGTNSVAAPAYAGADADTGLQCGTNELKLVTGGTARATVDSSGNFGIGTSSPASLLHLNTDGTALRVTRGSSIGFLYNTGTSSTDATRLQGNSGPVELYTNAAQPIKVVVNGTEEARFLSGGGLTFNGDSATANALSDYEEGTWTPTTYSNDLTFDSATYVKIGRMVTAHCSLTGVTSYTASTGNPFWIFGFPFTTASGGTNNTPTSATGSCKLTSMNSSITTGTLSVCMDKNNTRCRIQKNATNASDDFIRLSDVGTGSFGIVVNVTYYTT